MEQFTIMAYRMVVTPAFEPGVALERYSESYCVGTFPRIAITCIPASPRMTLRHTDLSTLNNLFKGDRARISEWIELYLEEAPGYFKRLEDGLRANDAEGFAAALHDLRPQAHYLGAPKLLELLLQIGEKAGNKGTPACAEAVQQVLELARQIEMELRDHASKL
jgi:HPt (histidine-containing phosphotransfer) domain-containing protein